MVFMIYFQSSNSTSPPTPGLNVKAPAFIPRVDVRPKAAPAPNLTTLGKVKHRPQTKQIPAKKKGPEKPLANGRGTSRDEKRTSIKSDQTIKCDDVLSNKTNHMVGSDRPKAALNNQESELKEASSGDNPDVENVTSRNKKNRRKPRGKPNDGQSGGSAKLAKSQWQSLDEIEVRTLRRSESNEEKSKPSQRWKTSQEPKTRGQKVKGLTSEESAQHPDSRPAGPSRQTSSGSESRLSERSARMKELHSFKESVPLNAVNKESHRGEVLSNGHVNSILNIYCHRLT